MIKPKCAVFLGQRRELNQLPIPVSSPTANTPNLGFSSLAGETLLLVQPTSPRKAGNYFFFMCLFSIMKRRCSVLEKEQMYSLLDNETAFQDLWEGGGGWKGICGEEMRRFCDLL